VLGIVTALKECPKCSTPDIETDNTQDFDYDHATQGVVCNRCGNEGREVYLHKGQDDERDAYWLEGS